MPSLATSERASDALDALADLAERLKKHGVSSLAAGARGSSAKGRPCAPPASLRSSRPASSWPASSGILDRRWRGHRSRRRRLSGRLRRGCRGRASRGPAPRARRRCRARARGPRRRSAPPPRGAPGAGRAPPGWPSPRRRSAPAAPAALRRRSTAGPGPDSAAAGAAWEAPARRAMRRRAAAAADARAPRPPAPRRRRSAPPGGPPGTACGCPPAPGRGRGRRHCRRRPPAGRRSDARRTAGGGRGRRGPPRQRGAGRRRRPEVEELRRRRLDWIHARPLCRLLRARPIRRSGRTAHRHDPPAQLVDLGVAVVEQAVKIEPLAGPPGLAGLEIGPDQQLVGDHLGRVLLDDPLEHLRAPARRRPAPAGSAPWPPAPRDIRDAP